MLRKLGFPSSTATIITLLAQQTGHQLALPETVLREYLSQRRRDLTTKVDAVRKGIAEMTGSAVEWEGRESWHGVVYPDVEEVITALELSVRKTFHVLDLTLDAARGALFREADRQAPAQTGDKAGGARDASIWLTTLDACKTASPAEVYFVSADGDFGSDGVLRRELAAEAPRNLRYCGGIDTVISALADPDETAQDEALKVFRTSNVRQAVAADLTNSAIIAEIMAVVPQMAGATIRSEGQQSLELDGNPAKVHGFRAGDTLFATGDLTWRSKRRYLLYHENIELGAVTVSFKVRNTVAVAMRPDGAIHGIQVVHRRPLTDIDIL